MLKILKDKILYFPYDGSKRFRNLTKIRGGIFKKMNDDVEIADGVTFGSFFNLLIKEKKLIDLVFGASLCSVPFVSLIQDFKKKHDLLDDGIQYLEIFWYAENNEDELSAYPCIHLIEINKENEKTSFGLDFLPLSELKEYPLKLNKDFEIFAYDKPLVSNSIILKTTKKYTFYEIVHAILYELTFYGTPEMRDNTGKSLSEQTNNIKTIDAIN